MPIIIIFVILHVMFKFNHSEQLMTIASDAIFALYNILLISGARQATLGMKKKGIKIIDISGNKISLMRSICRYLVYDAIYSKYDICT
jgi:uncharacterized RDD family membrane protein YckC